MPVLVAVRQIIWCKELQYFAKSLIIVSQVESFDPENFIHIVYLLYSRLAYRQDTG